MHLNLEIIKASVKQTLGNRNCAGELGVVSIFHPFSCAQNEGMIYVMLSALFFLIIYTAMETALKGLTLNKTHRIKTFMSANCTTL